MVSYDGGPLTLVSTVCRKCVSLTLGTVRLDNIMVGAVNDKHQAMSLGMK
jgi:hypothetical protein